MKIETLNKEKIKKNNKHFKYRENNEEMPLLNKSIA